MPTTDGGAGAASSAPVTDRKSVLKRIGRANNKVTNNVHQLRSLPSDTVVECQVQLIMKYQCPPDFEGKDGFYTGNMNVEEKEAYTYLYDLWLKHRNDHRVAKCAVSRRYNQVLLDGGLACGSVVLITNVITRADPTDSKSTSPLVIITGLEVLSTPAHDLFRTIHEHYMDFHSWSGGRNFGDSATLERKPRPLFGEKVVYKLPFSDYTIHSAAQAGERSTQEDYRSLLDVCLPTSQGGLLKRKLSGRQSNPLLLTVLAKYRLIDFGHRKNSKAGYPYLLQLDCADENLDEGGKKISVICWNYKAIVAFRDIIPGNRVLLTNYVVKPIRSTRPGYQDVEIAINVDKPPGDVVPIDNSANESIQNWLGENPGTHLVNPAYCFRSAKQLPFLAENARVDVIGIVHYISQIFVEKQSVDGTLMQVPFRWLVLHDGSPRGMDMPVKIYSHDEILDLANVVIGDILVLTNMMLRTRLLAGSHSKRYAHVTSTVTTRLYQAPLDNRDIAEEWLDHWLSKESVTREVADWISAELKRMYSGKGRIGLTGGMFHLPPDPIDMVGFDRSHYRPIGLTDLPQLIESMSLYERKSVAVRGYIVGLESSVRINARQAPEGRLTYQSTLGDLDPLSYGFHLADHADSASYAACGSDGYRRVKESDKLMGPNGYVYVAPERLDKEKVIKLMISPNYTSVQNVFDGTKSMYAAQAIFDLFTTEDDQEHTVRQSRLFQGISKFAQPMTEDQMQPFGDEHTAIADTLINDIGQLEFIVDLWRVSPGVVAVLARRAFGLRSK
eukprot:Clim_evm80s109 gene=Clim_evmTU80s109